MSIIKKLKLPELEREGWTAEELKELSKKVQTYTEELTDYANELHKLEVEIVNIPKMKSILDDIFNSHPEVKFIGFVNRICRDDDSGNCTWGDSFWDQIFIDDNDEVIELEISSELRNKLRNASSIFEESYPDLSFEGGDNAYWDSRADQWYGITRDMKAAFWADYDEDSNDFYTPVFELMFSVED